MGDAEGDHDHEPHHPHSPSRPPPPASAPSLTLRCAGRPGSPPRSSARDGTSVEAMRADALPSGGAPRCARGRRSAARRGRRRAEQARGEDAAQGGADGGSKLIAGSVAAGVEHAEQVETPSGRPRVMPCADEAGPGRGHLKTIEIASVKRATRHYPADPASPATSSPRLPQRKLRAYNPEIGNAIPAAEYHATSRRGASLLRESAANALLEIARVASSRLLSECGTAPTAPRCSPTMRREAIGRSPPLRRRRPVRRCARVGRGRLAHGRATPPCEAVRSELGIGGDR